MVGKIAKLYAFKKAPKATFMVLHPLKAAALKVLAPNRKKNRTARRVAMGAGAAAVALPLGYLVSEKLR